MRILWVKIGGLWPANSGGRLRSYHILNELARQHEVTIVTTRRPDEDPRVLDAQLAHCEQIIQVPVNAPKHGSPGFIKALAQSWFSDLPVDLYKYRIPAMRREVGKLLRQGNFDVCIADFLTGLPNVPEGIVGPDGAPVPVVLFTHNVEHMIWQRLCTNERNPLKRLLLAIEWRKMRRYERLACQRADLTLTVSDADKQLFEQMAPGLTAHAIPTGVDIDYFRPATDASERDQHVVFSGSMDWFPNEDGMLWFMESMLPLIRAQQKGISVTIVGRNPSAKLKRMAEEHGVHVTGTVDDVRPSVHEAAVYIVPLRVGGGTRLKIFEALAMGKAIVSTTVGAEGLPLEDGTHLVLADTPEAFASQVLQLINDPMLRARLGRAGRELVQARYSWQRVAGDFEALCRAAMSRRQFDTAGNTSNQHQQIVTGGSEI
ncbi:MAG TPA: glycosyltransferase family 4 protein [Pseudomonadales bacterium]